MASTASRDIHEFNLDGEYTEWSNSSSIPPAWRSYRSKIVSIDQFGTRPILLCDNESFTFLDRSRAESKKLTKIRCKYATLAQICDTRKDLILNIINTVRHVTVVLVIIENHVRII